MKKIISLLLMVLVAVSPIAFLVSCGGEKALEATTAEPTTAAPTEATTTAAQTTPAPTTATTTATTAPAIVSEYSYVNNDIGLKLKTPAGWAVAAASPFMVVDNSTNNNITIVEEQRGGYTINDYIGLTAQNLTLYYTQIGYVDIAANETYAATLGGISCTVLPIAVTANGVPMMQYMYFIENGDNVVEVTVTVVNGAAPSAFEAMFE